MRGYLRRAGKYLAEPAGLLDREEPERKGTAMDIEERPYVPHLILREPRYGPKPGEPVESPTLPLPPPRDRDELERLLWAVATTPTADRGLVVETIAAFDDRSRVADLFHAALFELPTADISRTGLLLSLIGELRHESSGDLLEQFVWLTDDAVLPAVEPSDDGSDGGSCMFPYGGMLQARAAEMLVWITGAERADRILAEHPVGPVRVATIDAVSYAVGDDEAELARLREVVRDEDRWAVGAPRRTDGADPQEFAARVTRHLEYLDSRPAPPTPLDRPGTEGE